MEEQNGYVLSSSDWPFLAFVGWRWSSHTVCNNNCLSSITCSSHLQKEDEGSSKTLYF